MQKYLKQILIVFTLLTLANCASGVGHNIKLKEFPEAKDVSGLNMYRYAFDGDVIEKRDAKENGLKPIIWGADKTGYKYPSYEEIKIMKKKLLPKSGCVLDVEYGGEYNFDINGTFGTVYKYVSGFSFYIIPYFAPGEKTIRGALIDAKTGKVIKEYEFKEKIVQSKALLPIFWPFYAHYDSAGSAAQDFFNAQIKLNEALIRTVTNDAFNFPECQKQK